MVWDLKVIQCIILYIHTARQYYDLHHHHIFYDQHGHFYLLKTVMTFPTWITWLTAKRTSTKRFRHLHTIFTPWWFVLTLPQQEFWDDHYELLARAQHHHHRAHRDLCSVQVQNKERKKYPLKFPEDSFYLGIAKVKITPLLQHIWWKVPGAGGQEKRWNKRPPEFAGGKNIPWSGRYFNTLNKFVTKLRVFWVSLPFGSPWRLRIVVWYKWSWKMTVIMLVQNGG